MSVSSGALELDKDSALASAATLPSEYDSSRTASPHTIGRYLIIRTLGVGGMGVVYSAYDEELDRRVAVKLLQPRGLGPLHEASLHRLRREAQALARLSHPNVVQIYDVGEVEEQLFLAMEYVHGRTLREWLRDQARDTPEIIEVFLQAGRGLAAAHRAGLVHRDFKPDNVMVGDDGRVRVLDFGLARPYSINSDHAATAAPSSATDLNSTPPPELTRAGVLVGTPAYMAPEQFDSQPTDERTDIFGFSVALYEALHGCRPFAGSNLYALRRAVIAGVLTPSSDERILPARLRRLLQRGLQAAPPDRFQTMDELLEELDYAPAAKRRRNLFIAIITFTLVLMTVGVLAITHDPSLALSCDAASSELSVFYNTERRSRVGDIVRLSGVPHAESTWTRIAPLLDDYAAAWSEARVDACEAHRQGRQSPRLFDLRTACLDQRRAGFEALLDVMEHADTSTIPKLVEAALSLPLLDPCADTEALTAAIPPPVDRTTAQAVQRIRERLAEVKAYESAGDFQRASELLDALETNVDALDYEPIKVEVLLRRGTLEMWQFKLDAADDTLATALYAALKVGHDAAAADAISRRIYIQSNLTPLALTEATRLGDALIQRVHDDKSLVATYYNNVGVLEKEAGRRSTARQAYQASLSLKREIYGAMHPEVGYTLSNLATLDIDEGYYDRAARGLVEAAAIFRETLGPQHFQTGALLSNLANAYALSGRWREATQTYQEMDEVFAAFPEVWSEMGPYILPERGDFHLKCRALDEAERDYVETLGLMSAAPEVHLATAIKAHIGLSRVAVHRSEWKSAEMHMASVKNMLKALPQGHPRIAADALELEATLLQREEQEKVEEVRALYDQALRARAQSHAEGTPSRIRAHLTYASALLDLGQHADAVEQFHIIRDALSRGFFDESPERWLLADLVGQEALLRSDVGEALTHLRTAVELREASRDEDDFDLALARFNLARALLIAGESAEARVLGLNALHSLEARGEAWDAETGAISAWLHSIPGPDLTSP